MFHTLYRNDTKPIEKRVDFSKVIRNLVNKDIDLIQIPEINDTYIAIEKETAQIQFAFTGSGQGEVLEESPQSNGQRVRNIIKLFESLNNENKIKKQKSAVTFVHRVTKQRSIH